MNDNETPKWRAENFIPLIDGNGRHAEWVTYIMYGTNHDKWLAQIDALSNAYGWL